MKILLVRSRPTNIENTRLPKSLANRIGYIMPLGIASIAAYLRKYGKKNIAIIDAEAEKLTLDETEKRMKKFSPDLVGITSMTPTIHDDLDIAKIAKNIGAKVVIGGPQVNAMPMETIQLENIDYGIRGEGEYPMLKLVEALENNTAISEIPGIVYKNDSNKVVMKSPYIYDNLDELPFPAIDLLPYEKYFSLITKGRLATICPGRGCPFKCGFCFKQPTDMKIRYRSAKSVVDEIEEVIEKYDIKEINFVSDTFTIKKDFIEDFCHEIINRNIKIHWNAPTRVDCVNLEMLKLMKKAGCRGLRFGIESGSEKILRLMQKSTNKKKMLQAFKWAKKAKIETFAYMIMGYLHETEDTIKETLRFIKKLKPDLLMYHIATPLPATKLFNQAVEAGLVAPDYWQKFLKDRYYPRIPYLFKDTQKWLNKAYRKFFFSPRFIIKKIIKIRPSNFLNYIKAAKGILKLNKSLALREKTSKNDSQ